MDEFGRPTHFGIRWEEFKKDGQSVAKEKIFTSRRGRDQFVERLIVKDNFWRLLAWLED